MQEIWPLLFLLITSFSTTTAAPQPNTQTDHVVIIDPDHPASPDVSDVLSRISLHCDHPDVGTVYNNSAFTGFTASINSKHVQHLNDMPDVLIVQKSSLIEHTSISRRDSPFHARGKAPWGLERVSNAFFQGSNFDTMDYAYTYNGDRLGSGVDIYMLDTGIWTAHNGFEGRAKMLWSFDGTMQDTAGHGTHTAGTAAAIDFGLASDANIIGLRVLDGNGGSTASIVAGLDQVVKQFAVRKQSPGYVGSVVSMSLGTPGADSAIEQAVVALTKVGIHICVAAGNSNTDACSFSPASVGGDKGPVIAVGSIDINSNPSSFSNHGDCVDVYAPGEQILSAGQNDPNLLVFMSGTSQATPHVTGLVAYAMSNKTLADSPALMKDYIRSRSLPLGQGLKMAFNGANNPSEGMIGMSKLVVTVDDSKFFHA